MLKKTIAALSLLSILAACQNDENPSKPEPKPRKDISLTRVEQSLLDANTDFAFRFFSQVCNTEDEKPNVFVSPLSASLCLSMISNGASGNTLTEMQDVLGFPASSFSLDDLNNYNQKLTTALLDLDNTTQLGIANSIWVKQGFKVYDSFVNVNKQMYDAQVQELDFTSPTAKDVINRWCAEQTNDCIKEVIKVIPANARMYLLNALYFKGIWASQFEKSATRQENFTNSDGTQQKVNMMNQTEMFNYTKNSTFSIAELPYGNEAFSMVILLPSGGKTLDESLSELTSENWKEWNSNMAGKQLQVKLPRFKVEYDKTLIDDMIAMGMKDAFDGNKADFSKMSAAELYVGILQQFTYINVDEEGTEAAAVTVGGMLDSAGLPVTIPFYVDSPFAFMIKEKSTGAILFMGKVTKL
ncbi:MAG: serpin [Bacteroides oleiciplenus]|uniref:Serpin B n=1 Tax=Bacteroides stercorirosoris TaxID=871324 RepID=A0A1M6J125_9BACE|nr:serpin family protein [Bacteroides stercorirosoris]OKZ07221.1 MAG: serpin [Bacteroides oleiciplenus]SHJ40418.1 serpin B [Bacteroides stercorirosoris]